MRTEEEVRKLIETLMKEQGQVGSEHWNFAGLWREINRCKWFLNGSENLKVGMKVTNKDTGREITIDDITDNSIFYFEHQCYYKIDKKDVSYKEEL